MGGILWIAKMVLKIFKPFIKIAIMESLMEALMGAMGEKTTPTDGI